MKNKKTRLIAELYGLQASIEHNVLYCYCDSRNYIVDVLTLDEIITGLNRFCDLAEQIVENTGAYNKFVLRVVDDLRDYTSRAFSEIVKNQTVSGDAQYTISYKCMMETAVRAILIGDTIERIYDGN